MELRNQPTVKPYFFKAVTLLLKNFSFRQKIFLTTIFAPQTPPPSPQSKPHFNATVTLNVFLDSNQRRRPPPSTTQCNEVWIVVSVYIYIISLLFGFYILSFFFFLNYDFPFFFSFFLLNSDTCQYQCHNNDVNNTADLHIAKRKGKEKEKERAPSLESAWFRVIWGTKVGMGSLCSSSPSWGTSTSLA